MNAHLGDRLHALADDLSAPATDDAREAVARRTGVLRRRRQVRRAVGGGVLAVLVLGGAVALRSLRGENAAGDVAGEGRSALPAWTFEHAGWEVTGAEDFRAAEPETAGSAWDAERDGSWQVFRRADDLLGPTAVVWHGPSGDPVTAQPGAVAVDSVDGWLYELGGNRFRLEWNPAGSDSRATVETAGLSRDEAEAFATGLQLLDGSITNPPAADDRFGFTATTQPQGIAEVTGPVAEPVFPLRRVTAQATPAAAADRAQPQLVVEVDGRGASVFDLEVAQRLLFSVEAEETEVAGHVAYRFAGGELPDSVVWQQGDALVRVTVDVGTVQVMDELIAGLRELTPAEWDELVAVSGPGDAEVTGRVDGTVTDPTVPTVDASVSVP